ncbi:CDP-diacylglycerol--glycerol-3-phosphate 3-phosphatidyltransferase [Oxobacter pfennigii]|uniref:CDP-diacylglycerol--glycerol-3-phosphate 3-phosphatidyltransferase n=1 Tax=Oxobacter pfennigii TaxID=36849 RepID=A0A0P8WJY0_9CLOT|nr:CDP-diacylglycerol--glycerol-3-phosphate 3-phosphatidyltransferase [Oxobacter pfennigii]KPU42485.1 CDP-diacylglycerol--glycerol-3-phosphate 3-phosphatidyltransferase [Oxobacter pfennigii]
MNLPNKITLSRIFLVPVFMLFIIPIPEWMLTSEYLSFMHEILLDTNNFILNYGNYVAAVIFIIAASTDKVDGYIARKKNLVTKFGIFLDPIADKLLIAAALIALVQRNQINGWAAMIIISREFIITGFRLVAAGEKLVLPAGIWGKLKTVIQSVAVALALLKNYPLSLISNFRFDAFVMFLAVIITVYSGYDYIAKNSNVIKET